MHFIKYTPKKGIVIFAFRALDMNTMSDAFWYLKTFQNTRILFFDSKIFGSSEVWCRIIETSYIGKMYEKQWLYQLSSNKTSWSLAILDRFSANYHRFCAQNWTRSSLRPLCIYGIGIGALSLLFYKVPIQSKERYSNSCIQETIKQVI